MQRRTFMTAALATAVLSLAGCAAQTRADTDMPAEAFTPEGADGIWQSAEPLEKPFRFMVIPNAR